MQWVGLQCLTVLFLGHTRLLFNRYKEVHVNFSKLIQLTNIALMVSNSTDPQFCCISFMYTLFVHVIKCCVYWMQGFKDFTLNIEYRLTV